MSSPEGDQTPLEAFKGSPERAENWERRHVRRRRRRETDPRMRTRRRGSSGWGRYVWGGLALALLVALAASFFLSRGAIGSAETQAQARAADWTGAVLDDALTPDQMQPPIPDAEYRQLLLTVQSGILSDERAARVRVWNADRALVLSTDQLDDVGQAVASDNPQLASALGGQTVSAVTPSRVAPAGGLGGTDERLYQTYVPLRLKGVAGVSGVAQIDQRFASIEAEAGDPWRTVRIGLVLALTAAAIMLVLTLRSRPGSGTRKEGVGDEGPGPSRRGRKDAERAADAEQGVPAAKERAGRAGSDAVGPRPADGEAEERVRELEERLARAEERATRAEERAGSAEERLREAAERASGGEPVRRGVPGVGAVATAEGDTRVVMELREAVADLDELKLKLSFADASLKEAEARLADRENAAVQIEQVWRATARELDETRAALADRESQLSRALDAVETSRSTRTGTDEAGQGADDRVAAAERRADEESHRAEALEEEVRQVEGELAEILAAAEAMATELEGVRRGGGEFADGAVVAEPVGSQGEVAELMARVAELESQRRNDVSELQRAQEALANTQLDATLARKRAKELEERLRELESGAEQDDTLSAAAADDLARYLEAPVEAALEVPIPPSRTAEMPIAPSREVEMPSAPPRQAEAPASEPSGSIAARLASIVREREAGRMPEPEAVEEPSRPGPRSGPEPEALPEDLPETPREPDAEEAEGLSLRERLARAAAARHRAPGAPGSDSD
jgi:hypothetical protein